jgi:hypothetical protein
MDGKQRIQLVQLISPKVTIPIHFDDYNVFLVRDATAHSFPPKMYPKLTLVVFRSLLDPTFKSKWRKLAWEERCVP